VTVPGAHLALRVVHPGSPVLRLRYRYGLLVTPHGYPDWLPYARATVTLPAPVAGRDTQRVLDVLAANELMAESGDPLWTFTAEDPVRRTPPGWVWAHTPGRREVVLVPAELHGAYRHAGGARLLAPGTPVALTDQRSRPVPLLPAAEVPEAVLAELEAHLGYRLPPRYRDFLGRTDGAAPAAAAVLPGSGFVADQPLFGLARADRHQELTYANAYLREVLPPVLLALGYVQGGLLVLDVRDDSVWYHDDDDPRSRQQDRPADVAARLRRCADDLDALAAALATPAGALLDLVDAQLAAGQVAEVRPALGGAALPVALRPSWQPGPSVPPARDPLLALLAQAELVEEAG